MKEHLLAATKKKDLHMTRKTLDFIYQDQCRKEDASSQIELPLLWNWESLYSNMSFLLLANLLKTTFVGPRSCASLHPLMFCSAHVLITLVPRPNHEFRAFFCCWSEPSQMAWNTEIEPEQLDDLCQLDTGDFSGMSIQCASSPIRFSEAIFFQPY